MLHSPLPTCSYHQYGQMPWRPGNSCGPRRSGEDRNRFCRKCYNCGSPLAGWAGELGALSEANILHRWVAMKNLPTLSGRSYKIVFRSVADWMQSQGRSRPLCLTHFPFSLASNLTSGSSLSLNVATLQCLSRCPLEIHPSILQWTCTFIQEGAGLHMHAALSSLASALHQFPIRQGFALSPLSLSLLYSLPCLMSSLPPTSQDPSNLSFFPGLPGIFRAAWEKKRVGTFPLGLHPSKLHFPLPHLTSSPPILIDR